MFERNTNGKRKGGEKMKVKVIKEFNDLQNDLATRAVNDVYECSEARAEELKKLGYVVDFEETETEEAETEEAEKAKEKPKKATKTAKSKSL